MQSHVLLHRFRTAMGHQQLLLFVLAAVIVGLAVVVGIEAFERNQKKVTLDALVNDGLRIAGEAQSWKIQAPLYGGGADKTWDEMTWADLGYGESTEDDRMTTLNGHFEKSVTGSGDLQLTGTDKSENHTVTITVEGLGVDQIITIVQSN